MHDAALAPASQLVLLLRDGRAVAPMVLDFASTGYGRATGSVKHQSWLKAVMLNNGACLRFFSTSTPGAKSQESRAIYTFHLKEGP